MIHFRYTPQMGDGTKADVTVKTAPATRPAPVTHYGYGKAPQIRQERSASATS